MKHASESGLIKTQNVNSMLPSKGTKDEKSSSASPDSTGGGARRNSTDRVRVISIIFTILLIASLISSGVLSLNTVNIDSADTTPPEADAGENKEVGVNESLIFDGGGSSDNVDIVNYTWDFDDGNVSYGITVTHDYTSVGVYTVTLTVRDEAGNEDTDSIEVRVEDTEPPVAVLKCDPKVNVDQKVFLNASGSHDNQGIDTIKWDYGDGYTETLYGRFQTRTYRYREPGTYNVTVTVSDTSDNKDSASVKIRVFGGEPLIAEAGGFCNITEGERARFNGSKSSNDKEIIKYIWTFKYNGSTHRLTGKEVETDFAFEEPGEYRVHLKVVDTINNSDTDTLILNVLRDSDNDGMPDTWEQEYNLDPMSGSDASEDADKDGYSNLEEYEAGTDPQDAASHPGENEDIFDRFGLGFLGDDYTLPIIIILAIAVPGLLYWNRRRREKTPDYPVMSEREALEERDINEGTKTSFKAEIFSAKDIRKSDFLESLANIGDITPKMAQLLYDSGYRDYQAIIRADVEDIAKLNGFDPLLANELKKEVKEEVISPPDPESGPNKTAEVGEEIEFDASQSTDNLGITSYKWNFGDGDTATGERVTHAYDDIGVYYASVTATNYAGNSAEDRAQVRIKGKKKREKRPKKVVKKLAGKPDKERDEYISDLMSIEGIGRSRARRVYDEGYESMRDLVEADIDYLSAIPHITEERAEKIKQLAEDKVGTPPTAVAGEDKTVARGELIEFDGSDSHDEEGIVDYKWEFDDGNYDYGERVTHQYIRPGDYDVTLTVRNKKKLSDQDTVQVKVRERVKKKKVKRKKILKKVDKIPMSFIKKLKTIEGIGEKRARRVFKDGYKNFEEIAEADVDELTEIPHITEKRARKMKELAEGEVDSPPEADAGEDKKSFTGDKVSFDGSNSKDDEGIKKFIWDFGDGERAQGESVTHIYKEPGAYRVTLGVINEAGLSDKDSIKVEIEEKGDDAEKKERILGALHSVEGIGSATAERIYQTGYNSFKSILKADMEELTSIPHITEKKARDMKKVARRNLKSKSGPVARAGEDTTVEVGEIIEFDGSRSYDDEGIIDYEWDLGDGYIESGESITHRYDETGTFTVTLTVTNEKGLTDHDSVKVNVKETREKEETVIEDIFLIYENGILVEHETRRIKPTFDDDVFSSMLKAIQDFVKDSFKGESNWEIQKIEFGDHNIIIKRSSHIFLAVVYTGEDTRSVSEKMEDTLEAVEDEYQETLKDWDGDLEKLRGIKDILKDIFT